MVTLIAKRSLFVPLVWAVAMACCGLLALLVFRNPAMSVSDFIFVGIASPLFLLFCWISLRLMPIRIRILLDENHVPRQWEERAILGGWRSLPRDQEKEEKFRTSDMSIGGGFRLPYGKFHIVSVEKHERGAA